MRPIFVSPPQFVGCLGNFIVSHNFLGASQADIRGLDINSGGTKPTCWFIQWEGKRIWKHKPCSAREQLDHPSEAFWVAGEII